MKAKNRNTATIINLSGFLLKNVLLIDHILKNAYVLVSKEFPINSFFAACQLTERAVFVLC